jgi:hypothetical protein
MTRSISNCFLLGSVKGQASLAGDPAWFHTLPALGEYPDKQIIYDGKEIAGVIVVDKQANDSCISKFKERAEKAGDAWRGLLVDREHFSMMMDKNSDSMAWAKEIREDPEGLWTRWEFTEPGKKLYDGNVLVSRSPVMDLQPLGKVVTDRPPKAGQNRFRPVEIISIAMTNTPQFETLSTFAAARAAETQPNNNGDKTMIQLLALLGLAETATEEEAIAAVQVLIDAAKAAEVETEAAQAEVVARRCDAFIAANKGSISDVAKFKENYLAAPDATEAAFGTFRATPGNKTRIIARNAGTPKSTVAEAKPDAQIAAKRNAAVNAHRSANPGCSFTGAWSACRAVDPGLFADEADTSEA